MSEIGYGATSAIRVRLEPDILADLVYGGVRDPKQFRGDDGARIEWERECALREHQVYRLLRNVVQQFNGKLKGRRERFKLVEEGDGLVIELAI